MAAPQRREANTLTTVSACSSMPSGMPRPAYLSSPSTVSAPMGCARAGIANVRTSANTHLSAAAFSCDHRRKADTQMVAEVARCQYWHADG